METWQIIVTIISSILASNGLWALISRLTDHKSKSSRLLLGLAYDRIVELCNKYIERGYITVDEYENLYKYLYRPYEDNGGDGIAETLMNKVKHMVEEGKTHAEQ